MLGRWFGIASPHEAAPAYAVEDLLRSLALIAEPEALRASIAVRMRELVGCDGVVLCGPRFDRESLVELFRAGQIIMEQPIAFDSEGTLVKWLLINEQPLTIPHPTGAFEFLNRSERDILADISARACVPLIGTDLRAIVILTHTDPAWRLPPADAHLLAKLTRQVGLAIENAELRRAERDRLENQYRAQQLAVAGQLAATVAHEIRNPLTAIRSSIQYVVEGKAEWTSKQRLLSELLEEVDRIEDTLGGILALSRPHELEVSTVNLVDVAQQSLNLIHGLAQSQSIRVDQVVPPEPLLVSVDVRELRLVFVNLLLNACQAMPDGGRLTLKFDVVHDSPNSRPQARARVLDTGCGVALEHLSKVFDPFFTTKRTGTGLGLSICLEVIARHSGHLQLESEAGRGTVVTILLPVET